MHNAIDFLISLIYYYYSFFYCDILIFYTFLFTCSIFISKYSRTLFFLIKSPHLSPHSPTTTTHPLIQFTKSGYFFDHFDEYRSAVELAIKNDELAAIEVIVPAGNTKRLFPLHMVRYYTYY